MALILIPRSFSDQYLRRTIAIFYGSFKDDAFKRQMKENRKIEELILMFVTTSTGHLKKDPQLSIDDGWKLELNNQIAQFIRILRECLRNTSHVPPELTSRLDTYASKLVPASASNPGQELQASSFRVGESSNSAASISDMPLAKTVATLFGKSLQDAQRDINKFKQTCTEKVSHW